MVLGKGSSDELLKNEDVEQLVQHACEDVAASGSRVLVIIPDGTRSCPLPLMFASAEKILVRIPLEALSPVLLNCSVAGRLNSMSA